MNNGVKKYRKKPVVIEAIQWKGVNLEEIKSFVGGDLIYDIIDTAWEVGKGKPHVLMEITTLEGNHKCSVGDYIIKGVAGEFYPCKPDIFEKTYDFTDVEDIFTMAEIALEYLASQVNKITGSDEDSNSSKLLLSLCRDTIADFQKENNLLKEKLQSHQSLAKIGVKATEIFDLIKKLASDDLSYVMCSSSTERTNK